ncbi:MAG: heme o synthase [Caldibacillus sp.]
MKIGEIAIITKNVRSRSVKEFFIDLKYLVKGKVLFANVLPVFVGFWLALRIHDLPFSNHWLAFITVLIGSTFVIAGALMLNNWYEADIDRKMERTQKRPTVNGHFSLSFVLGLGIVTTLIGFITVSLVSWEAAFYSFIGWFLYVVPYTFWTKRRFTWNTLVGAASGAVTPLIGWAVLTPVYHPVPIILAIILFIWQVPHTLSITIRRYEDYKRAGVPMLPVVRGIRVTQQHFLLYVLALIPWPFLLIAEFGFVFTILLTLMNGYYAYLALQAFSIQDHKIWADRTYHFSVRYLITLSFLLIATGFFV